MLADRNEKEVRAAAKELSDKGYKTLGVTCDVSDDAQVEAMVKKTVAEFGAAGCCLQQRGYSKRARRNGRLSARRL
jgi:NAD(P)-dependent dehydrogenase (short-subunit alcohol dehydrogenase family)